MSNFLEDAAQGYQALIQAITRAVGTSAFSMRLHNAKHHLTSPGALYRDSTDLLFMYIALYDAIASGDSYVYNLQEGARIVPAIATLSEKFVNISEISESNDKIKSLCNENNSSQVDSTLFEMLVALKYVELGYDVSFLPCSNAKTPDLEIRKNGIHRAVECKKLSRACKYSYCELDSWYKFSSIISGYVKEYKLTAHMHFSFKRDICNENMQLLAKHICREISKKGKRKNFTIKNTYVDVTFRQIPSEKYETSLDPLPLIESPSFIYYMTGMYNPNYGYKPVVYFKNRGKYVDIVRWGSVLSWESESDEVVLKKIQHVKKRLSEASRQLSSHKGGVAHFLIEQCQGEKFFMHSTSKNIFTVADFDDVHNALDLIYLHMVKYVVPLGQSFDVEETVSYFSKNMAQHERMAGCWYKAERTGEGFGSVLSDTVIGPRPVR